MSGEFWTRGELARRAGVKVATIRYYERRGLLTEAFRSGNGYHRYDRDSLDRLRFIRRAQELGFSLREIGELLDLRLTPNLSCAAEVRERAEEKIRHIREKIEDLRRMEKGLRGLLKSCQGEGPVSECPILEALEKTEGEGKSASRPASPVPRADLEK